MASQSYVALDVGERRIGVAKASGGVAIAIPVTTVVVDGNELSAIGVILGQVAPQHLIVGYPRNQSGEATAQTAYVEAFVHRLPSEWQQKVIYQDESLTSVHAENRLKASGQPYTKPDIDSLAASLILQDYLEQHHGRV